MRDVYTDTHSVLFFVDHSLSPFLEIVLALNLYILIASLNLVTQT